MTARVVGMQGGRTVKVLHEEAHLGYSNTT